MADKIDQRGRFRPRTRPVVAVVAALACSAAFLAPAVEASPVGLAAPAAAKVAASPDPLALPLRPAGSTYARQLLQRLSDTTADPADTDVVAFGGALDAGTSGTTLAAFGLHTATVLDARLRAIYEQVLGRTADTGGLAHYRQLVESGSFGLEDVIVALATSPEARAQTDGTDRGYVTWLYPHVLGRPADASGVDYWSGIVASTSRPTVARAFVRSDERTFAVILRAYRRDLRRDPDGAGYGFYRKSYVSSGIGELDLDAQLLGSAESRGFGCDGTDPRTCLLPFPNDAYTVPDTTTATGRRIAFKPEWMPRNTSGTPIDPREWNRNDGYSVGQALLTVVPGIDLTATGAAPVTDVGSSLAADAPIVLVDAATGIRVPYFAELDAGVPTASGPLLVIRAAVDYQAGHRYVVGLRNIKNTGGQLLGAPAVFARYRNQQPGGDIAGFADRQPKMESIFATLNTAGVTRSTLYNAWDFTVASTANTTGRLQSIRDRSLADLGAAAPAFTVTKVTENPATGVARRVEGTFDVPRYLRGDGGPGTSFQNGPDGLPVRTGTYQAPFDCEIPTTAAAQPSRAVVYGHGLFGSLAEVQSGPQRAMVANHDMTYCATTWIGMSQDDYGNAANILGDVSRFPTLVDRLQQGILNTIFLGKLLTTPGGFVSNPVFQNTSSQPLVDTGALFYDGNSLGAVVGGAYVAMSPDTKAGVLGVAGMNFSTLLDRSVDFDAFRTLLNANYSDSVDHTLGLGIIQMLWDRGETNGYAAHLGTDPLPGTSAKRVLLHVAVGDHQVSNVAAEMEARTAGMSVHRPSHASGRNLDVAPAWNLPATVYPSSGSGLVYWDSGSPLAPVTNTPPRAGADPHQDPRNSPDAQSQKSTFLATDGTLVDVCNAQPCIAPHR
jgi:hypothetical protein